MLNLQQNEKFFQQILNFTNQTSIKIFTQDNLD